MRLEISDIKNRFFFLYPAVFLAFIPFLLGMTLQEAETIYRDMGCYVVDQAADGCNNFKCVKVGVALVDYKPEWDEPIIIPEPEPEPSCIPTWCSLKIQDCDLPPLTGGMDSCGNPCTKPSETWENCIHPDGTIGPK